MFVIPLLFIFLAVAWFSEVVAMIGFPIMLWFINTLGWTTLPTGIVIGVTIAYWLIAIIMSSWKDYYMTNDKQKWYQGSMKAQIGGADALYTAIIFLMLTVFLFALFFSSQQIESALLQIPGYNSIPMCNGNPCFNQTITPYNATTSILNIYPKFDQYLPWLFYIINIAVLASVIFIPGSMLVYAIQIIIGSITVFISFILSNDALVIFRQPIFANTVVAFPNILLLWRNLPIYEIFFFVILLILIAAKARISGASGISRGGSGGIDDKRFNLG